jgi:L-threonylcarbamoyladenylate synthase
MKTIIGTDIEHAAALLRKGEVVAVPTETVYGLAANALDPEAVVRVFEAKDRPFFDPLIIHIKEYGEAERYVTGIPDWADKLASRFSPGPITFILKKRDIIPDIVTSGLDTVGIRIPSHPLLQRLLSSLDFPLAAPSANPFGYVSPTNANHVSDQLAGRIHYILDGGASQIGIESTIIGEEDGNKIVYRLGGISIEQIEEIIGKVEMRTISSSNPKSPGSLESHYAPKMKVVFDDITAFKRSDVSKAGAIVFQRYIDGVPISNQRILSESGDLHEAARNLFGHLRELDGLGISVLFAERVPDTGIGRAINDRLRRASVKH